ncbi:hypothetical protein QAD02_006455 [Eretmocerus hayati]|uniref:Uncharacterized protein n=1 Tax=Eretmocerus hayati TaxID=131215 RepID=A0ACC2N114_9HYME|nr:hypothetical protein QAD02_006455 [Eretmocerus hayati]
MNWFTINAFPIFIILLIVSIERSIGQTSLKSLSVVFRHGDRTPSEKEMYPKDPYYNTKFTNELGHLTSNGRTRAFHLGESLREKYIHFLGGINFSPETVSITTTDYNRTKTTLQMVLEGLYPSKNIRILPVKVLRSGKDDLLNSRKSSEYKKLRQELENIPEVKERIESFQNYMNELTNITGKPISNIEDIYSLYHILKSESSMGLTLPEWTKNEFPHGKIRDAALLSYDLFSYTLPMRKIHGGKLLRELIERMRSVKTGESEARLFLYSAHEDTLVALLKVLNIYEPHIPDYANAIVLELHETDNRYHIKIQYVNGISRNFSLQQIPKCGQFCELDKFAELFKDVTDRNQ